MNRAPRLASVAAAFGALVLTHASAWATTPTVPTLPSGQRGAPEMPEAPDGHPGLGTARDARELASYLRKPPEAHRDAIRSWGELPGAVAVRWNEYAADARDHGLFAAVPEPAAGEPGLAQLFDAWRAAAADLPNALDADAPRAEALARLHADVRLRLRAEMHAAFALERRELLAGLAVLNGMHDGWVVLRDEEAKEVCARVDLAAARLRSMRLDLDALAGDAEDAPGRPTDALVDELLAAARTPEDRERRAGLARVEAQLERTRERLAETLFWSRLEREVAEALRRREAAGKDAARIAHELRPYLPETPEGADPPEEIAEMKKVHRYAYALRLAARGLDLDPLSDDLAYAAGLATDFTHGPRETRPWFDRFLAIRGIRAHDDRTTGALGRALDPREEHALDEVRRDGPLGLPR